MPVVGQKISTLTPTAVIEDNDRIVIARQGANWGLLGSAIASNTNLLSLSANVKNNYIAKPLSPSAGQLLTWNSTTNTWVASGAPVSVPKGTNTGDLLVYNTNTSTWTTLPSSVLIPQSSDSVPIGTVMAYVSSTPPAGWIPCDGRTLSKTGIYADLYKVVGDSFTSPASQTTFKVPDLRGEFVRGWDNRLTGDTSAVDPSRTFGSNQTESISAHSHRVYRTYLPSGYVDDVGNVPLIPIDLASPGASSSFVSTSAVGGKETRPRNVALLYCIKYTTSNALNTAGLSAQTIIDRLPFGYLGQSQTWQDVTQFRLVNTWYVNSTNRPICVNISHLQQFQTGFATVLIAPANNSSTAVTLRGNYGNGSSSAQHISFIVPPDYQYRVVVASLGSLDNWIELR